MIDELSSPAVNGMMDTVSAIAVNETVRDYADQLENRLRHIHMSDADSAGSRRAWGEGTLPLHQYINDVKATGFEGALSLEFTGSRYFLDPYSPMRRSVEQLMSALGQGGT